MSDPHESSTFIASAVVERSGSPAVMYGMKATFAQSHGNQSYVFGPQETFQTKQAQITSYIAQIHQQWIQMAHQLYIKIITFWNQPDE